ncbi:MAG: hypothetical protein KJ623_00140 [Nanoarchaeota archaeon]|nr:hypothetical protein [Nanoarchaeota archaeon]MBU0962285.1 hypothetical protein [Nanoarchaeota archaeon]
MIESLEEAKNEIRRADHIIFISLKYARTCEVIMNAIQKFISCYDYGILSLLKKLEKEKKIKFIPSSPIERSDIVEKYIKQTKPFIKHYKLFKKITKCEYTPREEYRKHITMITKDKKPIEITTDVLVEYFEVTKNFIRFVEEYIT